MNWERAKNLMLLFFLLLNGLLAYANYRQKLRYTLSEEQRSAIYSVFSQNKISMYSKIIREYAPMRVMTVEGYDYDMNRLLSLLFPDDAVIDITEYNGRIFYAYGNIQLLDANGYIAYDNPNGFGQRPATNITATNKNAAAEVCDAFIQNYYPDYKLDGAVWVETGWRLCYRQVYQQYLIHTNFIEFYVTGNGIEQIDMQYAAPTGFTGTAQEIYGPDEALLTFVQRIRGISGDKPVIISNMDIVYYQLDYNPQENTATHATPYYRIFIDGQETPFMINAYTNQML